MGARDDSGDIKKMYTCSLYMRASVGALKHPFSGWWGGGGGGERGGGLGAYLCVLPLHVVIDAPLSHEDRIGHHLKNRLKCEIWERWGATYGRNGCQSKKRLSVTTSDTTARVSVAPASVGSISLAARAAEARTAEGFALARRSISAHQRRIFACSGGGVGVEGGVGGGVG